MTKNILKLNIGAGRTYIPSFVNLDISENAEIVIDISNTPLPFEDNSVDVVFSHHTLEHVENYLFAISEIHRVLKHGGLFYLGLPYVTLTEYNLVNPYHLHHFNEFSFDFFDPKHLKGSAVEENKVTFVKVFHRFHYLKNFNWLPQFMKNWCRRHLFNVVKKIDFCLVAIKNESKLPEIIDSQKYINEFDHLLNTRVRYTRK
jgi:SAM-dependent methyltransferase